MHEMTRADEREPFHMLSARGFNARQQLLGHQVDLFRLLERTGLARRQDLHAVPKTVGFLARLRNRKTVVFSESGKWHRVMEIARKTVTSPAHQA
jgi:hypothetical protein